MQPIRAGIDGGIDSGAADKAVKQTQLSKSRLAGEKNWLPKWLENPPLVISIEIWDSSPAPDIYTRPVYGARDASVLFSKPRT